MPELSRKAGTLFVVATPIGNLADVTFRAVETLKAVGLIAAEDTRVSRKLLQHYRISVPVVAYHEHNEREQASKLVESLLGGTDVALVSDAGTPLVSDPGYRLVSLAHERGVRVVPVPGCCAAVAALSAAGLPTDRFVFEGFLPSKRAARRARLEELADESRTLIFYESARRISDALVDLAQVFGSDREVTVAREVSKRFETFKRDTAEAICEWLRGDPDQRRGEFVILVRGRPPSPPGTEDILPVLRPLLSSLPLKQAVALTAEITGGAKNEIYRLALKCKT